MNKRLNGVTRVPSRATLAPQLIEWQFVAPQDRDQAEPSGSPETTAEILATAEVVFERPEIQATANQFPTAMSIPIHSPTDFPRIEKWCSLYAHPIAWRGFYGEVRCFTCCEPLPSAVRRLIHLDDQGRVVEFDPWATPIPDESRDEVENLTIKKTPRWRQYAERAAVLYWHASRLAANPLEFLAN